MKIRLMSVFILVLGMGFALALAVNAQVPEPDISHYGGTSFTPPDDFRGRYGAAQAPAIRGTAAFSPTWSSGGPVGAAVYDMAIDPTDNNNLFLATYGGVYRSTDAGATWDGTPNTPGPGLDPGRTANLAATVATAPGVVYATTGGSDLFHWSTDGGTTWGHGPGPSNWVYGLEVHPSLGTSLYAASKGVYTSSNSGLDWYNTGVGSSDEWFTDVAINPVTPTIVYAASGVGKVYKSVNAGENWTNSSSGLPGKLVWAVAVNPSNSNIVYAGLEQDGVYRSDNGGASWAAWSGADLICPYVREIAVDPANPNKVYISTDCSGVYSKEEGDPGWVSVGPHYSGQRRVYAMGLPSTAPNTIYAGVWGDGIYKSTDAGGNWQERNNGLMAHRINRIAPMPGSPGTTYATGRGGLFFTDDGGQSWERIRDTGTWLYSDAFGLDVDPASGTVFVGMWGHVITTTNGSTWYDASDGLESGYLYDIAINPVTPSLVYAGILSGNDGQTGVYKSQDGGAHWVRASTGITDTSDMFAIAVDPTSPNIVYAGTSGGTLIRSADNGDSWAWSGNGLIHVTGWPSIWDILPDPRNPGVVFLAQSNSGDSRQGGIYRSSDYGVSWERVLERHDSWSLVFDPGNHNVIYTSSWRDGIYRSEDGGDSWAKFDEGAFDGYPYIRTLATEQISGGWRLYAGTGGYSVWQRDMEGANDVFLPTVLKSP